MQFFWVFALSENNIWAHLGRDPQTGPNWTPVVPKGPALGPPKGPPWAQRAHLEAEGRLKGPLGPIGDPSCYPPWGGYCRWMPEISIMYPGLTESALTKVWGNSLVVGSHVHHH